MAVFLILVLRRCGWLCWAALHLLKELLVLASAGLSDAGPVHFSATSTSTSVKHNTGKIVRFKRMLFCEI